MQCRWALPLLVLVGSGAAEDFEPSRTRFVDISTPLGPGKVRNWLFRGNEPTTGDSKLNRTFV